MHEGSLPLKMIRVRNIQNGHGHDKSTVVDYPFPAATIIFNFHTVVIIIFHGQIHGTSIGIGVGGDGVGGGSKDVWIIFVIDKVAVMILIFRRQGGTGQQRKASCERRWTTSPRVGQCMCCTGLQFLDGVNV